MALSATSAPVLHAELGFNDDDSPLKRLISFLSRSIQIVLKTMGRDWNGPPI